MAYPVAGATRAPKVAAAERTQSVPKTAKHPANARAVAPQDKVTISAQARAAQQAGEARQTDGDAGHANSK